MNIGQLNTTNPQALIYTNDEFKIVILGGIRHNQFDKLNITPKITYKDDEDTRRISVDLYHEDEMGRLIRDVADKFHINIQEVRSCINNLRNLLENYRVNFDKPTIPTVQLKEVDKKEVLAYLKQPQLMQRLMVDIGCTGIINEENNRLLMYVAFTSRKLPSPISIFTVAASGAGKSYLQQRIAALIPEEDKITTTSLSNNALYYYDEEELDGKLLLIEDLDGVGAEGMYALREIQSNKQLTRTIVKRETNKTVNKTIKARIAAAGATTQQIYEDNANRAIIITLDNSEKQSQAIITYQQKLAAGKINHKEQEKYILLLQNIQRVLEPVRIINPLAHTITLPSTIGSPRRLMPLLLGVIESITFLNQYQRKRRKDSEGNVYIESTAEDIQWAKLLLKDTLLHKSDDLSSPVRMFHEQLKAVVKGQETFTTHEIRRRINIPVSTMRRHIRELVEHEYIQRQGNRFRGYYYNLRDDDFGQISKEIDAFTKLK